MSREQRFGSDSKEHMPSAYVRGTVITFPEEAGDIVARGENHGVAAHKDVKASEALRTQTKQKLLQLHAFNQAHKALPTSMLGMTGDISTMGDIHAAYIHGSVPTSVGESDDIMNLNFPDEVGCRVQLSIVAVFRDCRWRGNACVLGAFLLF